MTITSGEDCEKEFRAAKALIEKIKYMEDEHLRHEAKTKKTYKDHMTSVDAWRKREREKKESEKND